MDVGKEREHDCMDAGGRATQEQLPRSGSFSGGFRLCLPETPVLAKARTGLFRPTVVVKTQSANNRLIFQLLNAIQVPFGLDADFRFNEMPDFPDLLGLSIDVFAHDRIEQHYRFQFRTDFPDFQQFRFQF